MDKKTRNEYMREYNREKKELTNKLKEKVRMQEITIAKLEAQIEIYKKAYEEMKR